MARAYVSEVSAASCPEGCHGRTNDVLEGKSANPDRTSVYCRCLRSDS